MNDETDFETKPSAQKDSYKVCRRRRKMSLLSSPIRVEEKVIERTGFTN